MIDNVRLTFGFEGIWQGTAVLYDHQTKSLWMHLSGVCFEGEKSGRVLGRLDTGRHTTWADWRRAHPETDVLAQDPAFRTRGLDMGYFPREGSRSGGSFFPTPFLPTIQTRDARLTPAALLYGIVVGTESRAYPLKSLARSPVLEERLGGVELTLWFDIASRSAAAFNRRLDKTQLTFGPAGPAHFEDKRTKSRWTMEGVCISGPLTGKRLTPLHGLLSEWYGWYAHYPSTSVWDGKKPGGSK